MKYFVYCGARHGEVIAKLHPRYQFDREWMIHFFDPNPHISDHYALQSASECGAACVFHRKAVWIEDCKTDFQLQNCVNKDGGGSAVGALRSTNRRLKGGDIVPVEAIDFSKFVKELQSTYMVVRMDIEGSEFAILRKMIRENTLCKIRDLHIEWHHRHMPTESRESVGLLERSIREHGVNLFNLG
jgi:FkbM family methyltransferase